MKGKHTKRWHIVTGLIVVDLVGAIILLVANWGMLWGQYSSIPHIPDALIFIIAAVMCITILVAIRLEPKRKAKGVANHSWPPPDITVKCAAPEQMTKHMDNWESQSGPDEK